ncbi:MAG: hypothetical protein KUG77_26275 [Nannocystaceae bacterium]|nr:hypothetical protein [Nannocystaceae bacterium]
MQRWLKRNKRLHFHFIPTYSSWLNQVERWRVHRPTQRGPQAVDLDQARGPRTRTPRSRCGSWPTTTCCRRRSTPLLDAPGPR